MAKKDISQSDHDKVMAELDRPERATRGLAPYCPCPVFAEYLRNLRDVRRQTKSQLKVVKGKRSEL